MEPLACCLRAVKRAHVQVGDTVVVVGLGSIGCLFVQLFKRAGTFVAGADLLPGRASLALSLGADAAGNMAAAAAAARQASAGRGADHIIITGGGPGVLPWAAETVRDGGVLHVFAGGEGESLPLALPVLYARELTLMTTYSSSPVELGEAFDLIVRGDVQTIALVSHRLPLARLADAVALAQNHEALKVYLTP